MTSSNKVDMQKLAELASVSIATVSRALADSPLVREETKKRIRKLADEHDYSVNEWARNFRQRGTNIVTLVLMNDNSSEKRTLSPSSLEMIGNIADSLATANFDTVLYRDIIRNARDFRASSAYHQSAGIIVIGQGMAHRALNTLAQHDTPIIVWGSPLKSRKYIVVYNDNQQSGEIATQHLLEQGCRKIAFFGNSRSPENAPRLKGYRKALAKAGVENDLYPDVTAQFGDSLLRKNVSQFLDRNPTVDGIVCCSHIVAECVSEMLADRKLSVPEDVAIVSYDNTTHSSFIQPQWTTVRQDVTEISRVLVNQLLTLMSGKHAKDQRIPERITAGQSSRCRP